MFALDTSESCTIVLKTSEFLSHGSPVHHLYVVERFDVKMSLEKVCKIEFGVTCGDKSLHKKIIQYHVGHICPRHTKCHLIHKCGQRIKLNWTQYHTVKSNASTLEVLREILACVHSSHTHINKSASLIFSFQDNLCLNKKKLLKFSLPCFGK